MKASQSLATCRQFHARPQPLFTVLPLWRSWWRSSWWSSRALACCLLAYAVINVNLAASLIGHADHLLLGGGGALGGVAGRWENGLDGLDCPTLGRRGWGDMPLSSYMINLLFFWSLWRRWWWCFRADIGWCRRADVHAIVGNPLLKYMLPRLVLVAHFRLPPLKIRSGRRRSWR